MQVRFADIASQHPGKNGFDAFLEALDEPAVSENVARKKCFLLFDGARQTACGCRLDQLQCPSAKIHARAVENVRPEVCEMVQKVCE